jgi:hypothetical protein
MNASVVSALAALTGAAIGGLTTLVASWLQRRAQTKGERLAHYQLRRQELYKEFIEQAATLYIDALQSDKPDVSGLMRLYSEISRMRVLSSATVVASAEQIVKKIIIHIWNPTRLSRSYSRWRKPA